MAVNGRRDFLGVSNHVYVATFWLKSLMSSERQK